MPSDPRLHLIWPEGPAWAAARAAVAPALHTLLHRLDLPLPAAFELRVLPDGGPPEGASPDGALPDGALPDSAPLGPGALGLHPGLAGPALHLPADAALDDAGLGGLGLDRFRRLVGAIAEGAAAAGLAAGAPPGPWQIAAAADAVDHADPALGWAWGPAVGLLQAPAVSLLAQPRRGLWLLRWLEAQGRRPPPGAAPALSLADWLAFGRHVRDPARGPGAHLPLPVARASAVELDAATRLAPWSHLPLRLPGGPVPRALSFGGAHAPAEARSAADDRVLLLASLDGGPVTFAARPLGPVGAWALRSGAVAGQLGAARGVELQLHADGRAELTAADAFLGPPTGPALDRAAALGVSGAAEGRWRCAADADGASGTLQVEGLDGGEAAVHGRGGRRFVLPADEWLGPVRAFLKALAGEPLTWRRGPDGLLVEGRVGGLPLELRLSPAEAAAG
jgi:hypothetical protein